MMIKKIESNIIASLLTIIFTVFCPALVQADEVEEISYQDLVNQLSAKKNSYRNPVTDPLDSIQIHAGLGLITSANKASTPNGSATRFQNGFQLSLGIDLFSQDWAAEAALRNFGQATTGTETRSLREFDLKMMNRGPFIGATNYRLGAGLGTRYLKVTDGRNDVSIDDSTPTGILFGGIDAFVNKNISMGVEAGFRTSMVNDTADKGAMDMMVRFDTYF